MVECLLEGCRVKTKAPRSERIIVVYHLWKAEKQHIGVRIGNYMTSGMVADFSDPGICLALVVLAFTASLGWSRDTVTIRKLLGAGRSSAVPGAKAAHTFLCFVSLVTFTR